MGESMVVAVADGTVPEVVARVVAALDARGVTLFARIDHAEGARAAGLELEDEVLLVLGSPATGTAVMQADRRAGLDLPLRLLVWAEGDRTLMAYDDPSGLARRYDVDAAAESLHAMAGLMRALVEAGRGQPA